MDLLQTLAHRAAIFLNALATRRQLSALDDRTLADIGVERDRIGAFAAAAARDARRRRPTAPSRETAVLIRHALGTRAV